MSCTIARKAVGKAIGAPRVERKGDDKVDDGKRHHQGIEIGEEPACVVGEREVVERDRREREDGEENCGEQQPAADVSVDRRPAQAERRHQERDAGDNPEWHAGLGDPLLEGRHFSRRNRNLHRVRIVAAFRETVCAHSSRTT